jgi:hypothetical protein
MKSERLLVCIHDGNAFGTFSSVNSLCRVSIGRPERPWRERQLALCEWCMKGGRRLLGSIRVSWDNLIR